MVKQIRSKINLFSKHISDIRVAASLYKYRGFQYEIRVSKKLKYCTDNLSEDHRTFC